MNRSNIVEAYKKISQVIEANRDYLIELDQQNGDGDLGISMDSGFKACVSVLENSTDGDLGILFSSCASAFNEAAPSSLGTILSFGMMGIAASLRGKNEVSLKEFAAALDAGVKKIMTRAKSKVGEKTILDSLIPAIQALEENADNTEAAFSLAAEAAYNGSESTRLMRSVHGRASYYGDRSIGILDGGSVVGALIFKALVDGKN